MQSCVFHRLGQGKMQSCMRFFSLRYALASAERHADQSAAKQGDKIEKNAFFDAPEKPADAADQKSGTWICRKDNEPFCLIP